MHTIRVGIIGAGLNSDYHINFSKAYPSAQIVGVADADKARADDCARKHQLSHSFGSVTELLEVAKPEVVHVVTPPLTHFSVVQEVLTAGCHVLVEKPLAINGAEARALYDLAERRGLQLCPMHNHLFDPCMQRADALVKSGELGQVINVESYYGLNTRIPALRDYPKPNVLPWLYGLPGGVYQDFLPHPLYVLLEYTGACRALSVMQRSTGVLPQRLPDEIRMLVDGEHALGTVTFSFAAQPHLHFVRIYGTRMMVEVDFNTMSTLVHPVSSLPKAAQKATYNLSDSWQNARGTVTNISRFLTGKLKPYHGMRTLIHQFYDAVSSGGPLPVSKERALRVVETMDAALAQLDIPVLRHEAPAAAVTPERSAEAATIVLVTGGTGFLGKVLVRRLLAQGYRVRVLARKLSNVDALRALGADIFWGDVADSESFALAADGCGAIVHLAAGTSGSEKDSRLGTLLGTVNLVDVCRRHRPRKVVYISSCSVYGVADCPRHARLAENAPLERFPERRGNYSAAKQEAERYVAEHLRETDTGVVILRPGTIYGPGGELYTPMMGFKMGSLYAVIGTGGFRLPFIHVENLVDAIVLSLQRDEADGETFNVVDPEPVTKRAYINQVIRRVDPRARVAYLPYSLLYGVTWLQEVAFGLMKRRPPLTRYRLTSSQRPISYDSSKIMTRLGWKPRLTLQQALDDVTVAELSRTRPVRPLEPELAQTGGR